MPITNTPYNAAGSTSDINIQRQAAMRTDGIDTGLLIRGEQNDGVIEQERQKNADHNRQLLQRAKTAPLISRRDLSDVGRGQHTGKTNPQTTDDPPDDQADQGLSQRRSDGTDQKQSPLPPPCCGVDRSGPTAIQRPRAPMS